MPADIIDIETGRRIIVAASAPLTEPARNLRLRMDRRAAWRKADAWTAYCAAHMRLEDARVYVKNSGCAGPRLTCLAPSEHFQLVCLWREALRQQLLTPAPSLSEVRWKRGHLAQVKFMPSVTMADIERAIAADVAWLAAHPTRRRSVPSR